MKSIYVNRLIKIGYNPLLHAGLKIPNYMNTDKAHSPIPLRSL